jgi:hypothetical protein
MAPLTGGVVDELPAHHANRILAAGQQRRKVKMDAGRVDAVFRADQGAA